MHSNAGTHFQLRVDALRKLLSVGLEELGGRLERFEVFLVAYLPVSYGHEVPHDGDEARVVAVDHLVRQAEGCVLDE